MSHPRTTFRADVRVNPLVQIVISDSLVLTPRNVHCVVNFHKVDHHHEEARLVRKLKGMEEVVSESVRTTSQRRFLALQFQLTEEWRYEPVRGRMIVLAKLVGLLTR